MGSVARRALAAPLAVLSICVFAAAAQAVTPGAPGTSCAAVTGLNLQGSCFEGGDGNVAADNDGFFDWAQLASQPGFQSADDNVPVDRIFTQGSKEQDPSTWTTTQSSPPAKTDIVHVATYSETVGGHDFFYGAFDRASNNGDVNLDFEFNQNRATGDFPTRTDGDLLITFDGNSSSNALRLGACVWYDGASGGSQGWYPIGDGGIVPPPAGDLLKGSAKCPVIDVSTSPAGIGAINSGTIDASAIGFGANLLHDEFGEVAVDLTNALQLEQSPPPCVPFGDVFIHSRPSEAVANELKDYVTPLSLKPAGDCGFTVQKLVGVGSDPKVATTSDAPTFALAGQDLNYDVAVTNTGNVTLALAPSDAGCDGPLSIADTDKQQSDGSGGLEPDASPDSFDAGDVWTYHCQHASLQASQVDASGEYVNTATVEGSTRGFDLTLSSSAYTKLVAIGIDKTGPDTATAGDSILYTLTVTNPGFAGFPKDFVIVSDPLCDTAPVLQSTNTDATPDTLDPGDFWTYACSVQTHAGDTSVHNVATVQGTVGGRTAVASDDATTTLSQPPAAPVAPVAPATPASPPPAGAVSPVSVLSPGSARLRGLTGCAARTRPATFTVTGKRIARVTFFLDGRKVRSVTRPDSSGRYRLTVSTRRLRPGAHRVKVRIQFTAASGTKTRTLSKSFDRCVSPKVQPKFTG
jgi:uncharacterized repeat protein (TIGR01451 family)